jgi:hypothetical protein
LIWIEENSYYSSKDSTDYIKDITKTENITKNCRRHEGCESTSISLHHHHHSSLQKNLWCNNAQPLKFSLKHASLQAPPWRDSLRQVSFISIAAATAYHPIGGITNVGAIGVVGGGGWGQRSCSRRWHNFNVDGLLLVHLIIFIRVAKNDDLAIIKRP